MLRTGPQVSDETCPPGLCAMRSGGADLAKMCESLRAQLAESERERDEWREKHAEQARLNIALVNQNAKLIERNTALGDEWKANLERSLAESERKARQFMAMADALADLAVGREIRCVVSGHPGIYECRTGSVCVGCRARHRVQEYERKVARLEAEAARWHFLATELAGAIRAVTAVSCLEKLETSR